jgi:hypothetical protein
MQEQHLNNTRNMMERANPTGPKPSQHHLIRLQPVGHLNII